MLNVVLIGAGNLGFNFYREFYKNEKIDLIQWYNKTIDINSGPEKPIYPQILNIAYHLILLTGLIKQSSDSGVI